MVPSDGGIRAKRLAGTVRKHLSAALARDLTDPRLTAVSIEDVSFSGDLGLATVRVRLLFGGEDPAARRGVLAALGRAAPGLRSQLAPLLRMRRVPELRFYYDEGTDHRRRIEEVLAEIHREEASREVEAPEGGDAASGNAALGDAASGHAASDGVAAGSEGAAGADDASNDD